MKSISRLLSTLLGSVGIWSLTQVVASAVTLNNSTIAFAEPPYLVSVSTPYTNVAVPEPTYYFTIQVPANAGEQLQQVTFTQIEGTEQIEFNQNQTFAFEGTRNHQGSKLTLHARQSKDKQQTFTVTLDSPVSPGKTVTIGLRPYSNPLFDGVYLFSVTAFPSGQKTTGQTLGVGRLQFYTNY